MKYLETNIEAIEKNGGHVDRQWLTAAAGGYGARAIVSEGVENIVVEKQGGILRFLHSPADPAGEAAGEFSRKSFAGRHALLYGLGAGHYVAQALRATGVSGYVTVIECSSHLAAAALAAFDFSDLAAAGARFFIGPGRVAVPLAEARLRQIEASSQRILTKRVINKIALDELGRWEHSLREFLGRLRLAVPHAAWSTDPRIRSAYAGVRKKILLGHLLDDGEMALLAIMCFPNESRYIFTNFDFSEATPPERVERLLLISLSAIGDLVISSPMFRAYREKYPGARITLLTETPNETLYTGGGYIDSVIFYRRAEMAHAYTDGGTWENVLADRERFLALIGQLRAEDFDAVANLHFSSRSAIIAGMLGLPHERTTGTRIDPTAVALMRGNIWMRGLFLSNVPAVMPMEETCFRLFDLVPRVRDTYVNLPEITSFAGAAAIAAAKEKPVAVCPFGSSPNRRWRFERYLALCKSIVEETGRDIVVVSGGGCERNEAAALCDALGDKAIACVGEPLEVAARVLAECDLMISNDTGPMHVAGAAGTLCLIISGATLTLPYSPLGHLCVFPDMPCLACGAGNNCTDRKCFDAISPDHVLTLARLMLTHPPQDTIAHLSGPAGDGEYPLLLITNGTYRSLTPQYQMRIRDSIAMEYNMASEFVKVAVFNVVSLIRAGALYTGHHPAGVDQPGLASPFTAVTTAGELLRRWEIAAPDMSLFADIVATLPERMEPALHNPSPCTEDIRLFHPMIFLARMLTPLGMAGMMPRAMALCRDFLREAADVVAR